MQRRLRRIFIAIKEHSCVSYAKVATIGGFCDIDLLVVKATSPDDLPFPEKYIQELLKIFSISPSSFHAFSISLCHRFGKTRCWRVALKCLLLLHRLLRLLPEDSPFRSQILWTRSNGLISLYPCRFRDDYSSAPEDYTMFIRSYAQLLDEALDCFSLEYKAIEDDEEMASASLQDKMKEIGRMLEVLPQLQSLIDRVMNCRPIGAAARSFVIQTAMKHIIRDSFICYSTFRRDIVLVLDNLFQMPYRSCISAFGIYKRAALQANQLWEFYDWCRAIGFCGSYEYPFVDRIPQMQIRALETFINGMWQLTESSTTTTSTPSSLMDSGSSLSEDERDKDKQLVVRRDVVVTTQWEKFEDCCFPRKAEEEGEMKPLIQFEDSENDSWEDLLEASVNLSRLPQNNLLCYSHGFSCSNGGNHLKNEWQIQPYNPSASNPFHQPSYIPDQYASFAGNPTYPWGL